MKTEEKEDDLAFMILYKWQENQPEGPQNRKKLAGILFDLNERRLAEMVASKKYTKPSGPHSLSWEMGTATNTTSDPHIEMVASKKYTRPSGPHSLSWEMGTTTSNATSDIAVRGTSAMRTAGMGMKLH